jgi:hypothetical protein
VRCIRSILLVEAAADCDRPRSLWTVAQGRELLRIAQRPHLHLPKAQGSADMQQHRMPKEQNPRCYCTLEVDLAGSRMPHSERRTEHMLALVRIHPLLDTH